MNSEGQAAANGPLTVFVKNLPFAAHEDDISAFFGDCGDIREVYIGEYRTEILTL